MKIKTKNINQKEDIDEVNDYIDSKIQRNMANTKSSAFTNVKEFTEKYSTRDFTTKSKNQKLILQSICNPDNIITVVSGKAGTGKTFSAIQGTLKEFKGEGEPKYKKIYLMKSVKTLDNKSEDIGFLKGNMEDKVAPFMFSYDFNFAQIIDSNIYGKAREQQIIEFLPLAYIRGVGLSDCIIILDEAQNINSSVLRTVLSRIGANCKLIILGDTKQKDSSTGQTSGLEFLIKHFNTIKGIDFIEMNSKDQTRAKIINVIEDKYDKLEEQGIVIT
jgi:phosphate starvation-inducible PhoH-like protein